MTTKSFVNKYGKLLASLAGIFAIVDYILRWLDLIPWFIAIALLLIAALLLCPVLLGIRSGSRVFRIGIRSIAILFVLGLGYHFVSDKSESDSGSEIAMNLETENSIKEVNNKKNSIEINAPITTNGNSKLTIANEIYNYNKHPQRHLTESDFKRLEEAGLNSDQIQILFPQHDNEASAFGDEIFDKLFEKGSKNLSKGYINGDMKFSPERFSIKPINYPPNTIRIIVNPQ